MQTEKGFVLNLSLLRKTYYLLERTKNPQPNMLENKHA